MNLKKHDLLCLLFLIPAALHAQAGSSGLSFLKLGVAGRGVSMADAMSANVTGAAATHYNPSGLLTGKETSMQILFMHKEWIQAVRSEFLGVSLQLNDKSALGLAINTASVSDIEIRTRPGTPQGTFNSRDLSLGLSYARIVSDELRLGITAKLLYEKIFLNESNGVAFDFGAQYKSPVENLDFGLVVANLGSMKALQTENIVLPSFVRLGPAYTIQFEDFSGKLVLASDIQHIFPEKKTYFNLGAEFVFNNVVAARAGYHTGSDARKLSAGVGLQYGLFILDYAYVPLSSDLGSGHTFSLALNF